MIDESALRLSEGTERVLRRLLVTPDHADGQVVFELREALEGDGWA